MHFDQSGSRILTRPKLIKLIKLIQSFDWNNSEGKASLKQQKSPETTTDTQDASVIDFTSKIFIFRNIYRCKSTIFRSPYYSLQRVQIFNGSSRNLTPSHTTRDAFMN